MSDQHQFNLNFNDDDVIQFGASITRFTRFKWIITTAKTAINKLIFDSFSKENINVPTREHISNRNYLDYSWLDNGVPCQILRIGSQGWEKGKIRIKFEIEFIPDEPEIQEPESCLDDIRREIQKM